MIKRARFALMDFGQRPLDTKIDLLLLICQIINISKHSNSDKLSTTAEAFRSLKFLASWVCIVIEHRAGLFKFCRRPSDRENLQLSPRPPPQYKCFCAITHEPRVNFLGSDNEKTRPSSARSTTIHPQRHQAPIPR